MSVALDRPTPQMYIINKHGVVHQLDGACKQLLMAPRRVPVSRNQAWLYHLPACRDCWPREDDYLAAIGAPRK